jgi:hypothetical protein
MNTEMTPSNGMSSLNTDAMTSSQRLWPNPSPQLEHYVSVTKLLAKRISQVSLQCWQGPPQFWAFRKANSLTGLLGDFDKVHLFPNFYRPIAWTLRPTC